MNRPVHPLVVTGRSDTSLQKSSQMATLKPQGTNNTPCRELPNMGLSTLQKHIWDTYPPYVKTDASN